MLSLLKRYRDLLVVSALLLFPLWTLMASGNRPRTPHLLDRLVLATAAPLQRLLTTGFDGLSELGRSYLWLKGVARSNQALSDENAALKRQLQAQSEARIENGRLKALLSYTEAAPGPEIPGRVIGVSPVSTLDSVWIDRGETDGVLRGMPVITPEGVVGFVHQSIGHSAEVLLLSDPNARVGVRIQRSRARATAAGTGGDRPLSLRYALRSDAIEEGDRVVTSGTDGMFPSGLVVGSVKQLKKHSHGMFQTAEIQPAVDFTRVEEVLVLPQAFVADAPSALFLPWATP